MSEVKNSINLFNRTRAACHYPNAKGKAYYPLYKRATSNTNGGESDEGEWGLLARAVSDPDWAKQIQSNFGSPRNIKRLFIGVNRAIIHLWVPVIKDGKQKSNLVEKISFGDVIDNAEVKPLISRGESDKHKISNSRLGISTIKEWALSNVEEIYFDWTALASKDNNTTPFGTNGNKLTALGIMNRVYSHSQMEDDAAFKDFISGLIAKKSLEIDYPRLKRVMMIENLDSLLDKTAYTGKGEDTVDKMAADWLDVYDIKASRLGYIGFKGSNYHKVGTKFRSTINTYELDRLYLIDKFRDISRKINRENEANKIANSTANSESEATESVNNEFDKYLNTLYDRALSISGDKASADKYLADTLSVLANADADRILSDVGNLNGETMSKLGKPIERALGNLV